MLEAASSSEMCILFHQTAQCHIQKRIIIYSRPESVKSRVFFVTSSMLVDNSCFRELLTVPNYILFSWQGKEDEAIHYDDKAIDELLDRSKEGIEQKENWANEYLSSFKVASYVTKEGEDVSVCDDETWSDLVLKE